MKRKLFLFFLGLVLCGAFLMAQTLDEALLGAAVKMSRDLPANTTAAIINFHSDSEEFNDYVINELYGALLRNRRITPIMPNQSQLQNIRSDLSSNATDTVNRETAQRIGQLLGVRYLITGSIERIGLMYKIIFNAVDTDAELKSQYSASLNLQNDTRLALLLGGILGGSSGSSNKSSGSDDSQESVSPAVPARPQKEKKQAEPVIVKPVAVKFSFGNIFGITSFKDTNYHEATSYHEAYEDSGSGTYLNIIMPVLSLRLLFSLENKLRFGLGVDGAFSILSIPVTLTDGFYIRPYSFPSYAILGYSNIYLHIGYDFGFGALYAAPSFTINEHLMIGIPVSLWGSNQRFGLLSYADPPDQYDYTHDSRVFQIGLSIQYVFSGNRTSTAEYDHRLRR